MANLFGSGKNKKVTGKAADSGYDATKTTIPKLQVQLPNLQNLFQSNTSKTTKQATGKAADSGYTAAKKQASQQANRQTVQKYTNILSQDVKQSFGGLKNDSETQRNLALASKQGVGTNWSEPKRAVGNAIESAAANSVASYLNAAGTVLKDDRKHGLAADSDKNKATVTGNEWYNRAGNYLQRGAEKVQKISENAYARGAANLNSGERLLYDAGIAGAQMLGDMATGIAPVSMAVRSFGSGAKQARDAGASHTQQLLYGGANAAVELLTEKLFDGVAGIYGKGAADDVVSNVARKLAKSDTGQAFVRSLAGMGLEGAEEVISGAVNPALQTIYNGKSIGENYRGLDAAELLYEGAIGALLGGLGGNVDIARTMSGNLRSAPSMTRNNTAGSMYDATGGVLRGGLGGAAQLEQSNAINEARLYTPYVTTYNATKPITSYTDMLQAMMQSASEGNVLSGKGLLHPYSNNVNNTGTVAPAQGGSYADVFRQIMTDQDATVLGANKNDDTSELAHYQELEQKYLDGSISPDEADELWKLEHLRGRSETPSEDKEISDAPVYDRYLELERKFLSGSINEQEWNELLRLENILGQFSAASGDGSQRYQIPDSAKYEGLKRTPMDGNIIKKVVFGHSGTPKMADPKSVIDHQNEEGVVDARAFYGDDGMKVKDLHTSDHGNPKRHNYGRHGEHAHDYEWNDDGSLKGKITREWSDEEREMNGDIL